MKILVCIKTVLNAYVKVKPTSNHDDIKPVNLRYYMNPFDEIAVEEAIRQKEIANHEVVVVCIGSDNSAESIKKALAMGADRAIHITTDLTLTTLEIAKAIATQVEKENIDLVIMGKQSIDGDHNHTGQMLAALLDWPQGTYISQINIDSDHVDITREVDNGLENISVSLPAVVTTDLRLNEPRYPSLPNILKAKKKPIDVIEYSSLNIKKHTGYKITRYDEPPQRHQGVMVDSVDQLIEQLALKSKVNQ